MLTISLKTFRPRPGDWILDAGCGEGRHSFAMYREQCRVFALDRDLTSLRKTQFVLREMHKRGEAKGEALVLQGDNLRLPFRDGSFDKVLCAEVLEHIAEDRQAVLELVRVTKPAGQIAITVPTPFTEATYGALSREYFRTPGGHIRIYRPRELSELLTSCGLRIQKVGFAHSFHSLYWVLRCLCGLHNAQAKIPKLYHRFLHRVVLDPRLRGFERSCNYLFPKSMVLYAQRPSEHLLGKEGSGHRGSASPKSSQSF
ncbi:MAG: class I SAM-dependent methyltransferase [Thermodesulfobacteriota bacterium]